MNPSPVAQLQANVAAVRQRILAAAARAGRDPAEVALVGASKTVPAETLRLAVETGLLDLGENRMQEALPKIAALSDVGVRWHFIGQLQTNKVKYLENRFHLVHSVDRAALALAIDRQARAAGRVQAVLVQVNVSGTAGQGGVAPAEAAALCELVESLPGLRLEGLMGIAPEGDPEAARPAFRSLRQLRDRLVPDGTLSMGMTGDFEVAVEEGATLVRVGRAIFGPREVG